MIVASKIVYIKEVKGNYCYEISQENGRYGISVYRENYTGQSQYEYFKIEHLPVTFECADKIINILSENFVLPIHVKDVIEDYLMEELF